MSKFNMVAVETKPEIVLNNEGHAAYAMGTKEKLVSQVLTSFFNEAKFYGDNSDEIVATIQEAVKTDPAFVSNLAIFARREFNMRSISHVLIGYLANIPKGKPFVKRAVKGCVLRGDDATEILAFYLNTFGKPIPNSLRKGLREVFQKFDVYTLAKYKGDSKSVKMKDILCLCHPTPKDDMQSETWKALLEDRLQPAYTWETVLSARGNTQEVWEELIASGEVGYMALLRNLRNIINAKPHNVYEALDRIADPDEVRKSRQLPFRYMSAYRSVPTDSWASRRALEKIDEAADIAVENLPKIPGRTVIAIDTSGSMGSHISQRSDIRCCDISMMLGLIANRICENVRVFTFDTQLNELRVPVRDGLISTAIRHSRFGGGTNMELLFNKIYRDSIECDRLIIISDNECNTYGTYGYGVPVQKIADIYRQHMNKDFWVHAIDLMGYGTQQFAGRKTNIIAGWSEKVFEFILLAEQGEDTLVKRIENYTIH